ncbi:MAG: hypothetical protein EHJ95_08290 [Methanobacteriota archaeon]|nr:MAG: hypothetical protein EHJ95_08290 [Euryarchaeota archaeon]
MKTKRIVACAAFLWISVSGIGTSLWAGPPLVCFPFETDHSQSLPWGGSGWHETRPDYDTAKLAADTLSLLQPETPVIARMETIRRSALYGIRDQQAAKSVIEALKKRMQGAKGEAAALAQFDLGYFVETYKQALPILKRPVTGPAIDGYALVVQAVGKTGNPEMEFAAALMSSAKTSKEQQMGHLRRAAAGAKEGSLLARNLVSHFNHLGPDLRSLRASVTN